MDITNDPLGFDDFDPNEVDTSRPLLAPGDHPMRVKSVQIKDAKKPGNRNLEVVFELTQDAPSESGDRINAGYVLTRYYPLQQSTNERAPDYRIDLVKLLDGVLGTAAGSRPKLADAIQSMAGRLVMASVIVRQPKPGSTDEQYGPSNEIRKLVAVQ